MVRFFARVFLIAVLLARNASDALDGLDGKEIDGNVVQVLAAQQRRKSVG
jgi:hypothetical protein